MKNILILVALISTVSLFSCKKIAKEAVQISEQKDTVTTQLHSLGVRGRTAFTRTEEESLESPESVEEVKSSLLTTYNTEETEKIILHGYMQVQGQVDSTEFIITVIKVEEQDSFSIYQKFVILATKPSLIWLKGIKKHKKSFDYTVIEQGIQLEFGEIAAPKINYLDVIEEITSIMEKNNTKLLSLQVQ